MTLRIARQYGLIALELIRPETPRQRQREEPAKASSSLPLTFMLTSFQRKVYLEYAKFNQPWQDGQNWSLIKEFVIDPLKYRLAGFKRLLSATGVVSSAPIIIPHCFGILKACHLQIIDSSPVLKWYKPTILSSFPSTYGCLPAGGTEMLYEIIHLLSGHE